MEIFIEFTSYIEDFVLFCFEIKINIDIIMYSIFVENILYIIILNARYEIKGE